MTEYEFAPEVETVAKDLIASVEDHADLADVQIRYVFRDKAIRSKGRVKLASARRLSGLHAFLAQQGVDEALFVIEVAKDTWQGLTEPQRRALVDHELCHCATDTDDAGDLVLRTRGHDVEEFVSIINRHGLWKADVQALGTAAAAHQQLALELADADPPAPAKGLRSVPDPFQNKGGRA